MQSTTSMAAVGLCLPGEGTAKIAHHRVYGRVFFKLVDEDHYFQKNMNYFFPNGSMLMKLSIHTLKYAKIISCKF